MENQHCQECGERIVGRSDKRFCTDYCRNTHNNKMNSEEKLLIRKTNNRLRRNWRILDKLNPKDTMQVSKEELVELGFDFNLFTNIYWTRDEKPFLFCYNQGILQVDEHVYSIVKKAEN